LSIWDYVGAVAAKWCGHWSDFGVLGGKIEAVRLRIEQIGLLLVTACGTKKTATGEAVAVLD
jgi:hypothetical protein